MALTWEFQDSEYSSWSKEIRKEQCDVASALIWLTLGVDFNMREGEKDIDEFLWRARCYELVTGAFLSTSCSHKDIKKCEGHTDEKTGVKANGKGNIPVPFTREMIAPYAGLSTNVIRLSRAKRLTKMKKRIAEDATSSLRRSESLD